ncbi:bacteriohemerythrin [Azospirillum sp.]|uniref:bacteriohemerythrin n=1 Tax=Azospirillum sp. TaxID=34012 RepID=UPI003D75DE88
MPDATLLAWKDAWSIGVPELDREHAALVQDFARLIDPARRGDHAFQRAALDALTEHVCRHFDHEEHLMRECAYPELRRHAEVHAMLLRQLTQFEALLNAQPEDGAGPSILDFVGRWLLDHIQEDDMRLGVYLRDRFRQRKAS